MTYIKFRIRVPFVIVWLTSKHSFYLPLLENRETLLLGPRGIYYISFFNSDQRSPTSLPPLQASLWGEVAIEKRDRASFMEYCTWLESQLPPTSVRLTIG